MLSESYCVYRKPRCTWIDYTSLAAYLASAENTARADPKRSASSLETKKKKEGEREHAEDLKTLVFTYNFGIIKGCLKRSICGMYNLKETSEKELQITNVTEQSGGK